MLYHQVNQEFKEFQLKMNEDPSVINILKEDHYKPKLEEWLKNLVNIRNKGKKSQILWF
jgi:hypothetical protein